MTVASKNSLKIVFTNVVLIRHAGDPNPASSAFKNLWVPVYDLPGMTTERCPEYFKTLNNPLAVS
jgi:hypothetical protein